MRTRWWRSPFAPRRPRGRTWARCRWKSCGAFRRSSARTWPPSSPRKAPPHRAGTSAGRRRKRCAPRSPGRAPGSEAARLGRFLRLLRLEDPADPARLRPREPVAHPPAAVDALRKLLAPAAVVADAEGRALVVFLERRERLAERRDGVPDAVGA